MNLFVVRTWYRVRFRRSTSVFEEALHPDGDPEDLDAYLLNLFVAWIQTMAVLGLASGGVGYLLDQLFGGAGKTMGAGILVFVFTYCFVGALDAGWRYELVALASKRLREGDGAEASAERLRRYSRVNDATLVVQLLAAALVATLVLALH